MNDVLRTPCRLACLLTLCCLAGIVPCAAAESLLPTFGYDRGHASAGDKTIHIHEATLSRVAGIVRVHATAAALPANPVAALAGQLQGAQQIQVGQRIDGQFVPAIQFGLADSVNARMGISWIRGTYLSPTDLPAKESLFKAM